LKAWDIKDFLLATAIFLGMEGQAPHNCPWCRGNPRDFTKAAGPDKEVLEQRTAATQAADFAAFRPGAPHVNGVQAEPLIPIDWDWLIPPWLHLILGTGNEVVKKIYVELLLLDGVDQASIDNVTMNAEELTELEHCAIDTIEDAIGHLGPDHAAVKALGEDKGAAEMAEGDSTDHWMPLVFALKDLAEQKRKDAHAIRNPEGGSLPALSKRARSTAEAEARPFDDLAQCLEAEAQELTERLEDVTSGRSSSWEKRRPWKPQKRLRRG